MAGCDSVNERITDRPGVVVIGRNEGERLVRCLRSLAREGAAVVYVDSGSTDGSVERAEEAGAIIEHLSTDRPFSAARARNAGFRRLRTESERSDFVQFVDGDSIICDGWMQHATAYLRQHADVGIVGGRLRELHPDVTIYNRLCDSEFRRPEGDCRSCDGIFTARRSALEDAGLFDEAIIAGEEPELCHRLRAKGWRIVRIERDMARHDAAMTSFRQWWQRRTRGGHAFAEALARYGAGARSCLSSWLWVAGLPISIMVTTATLGAIGLVPLLLYPLQIVRVAHRRWRSGERARHALLYATFCLFGKAPEAIGQLRYVAGRLRGRRSSIIEYKTPAVPARGGAES